MKESFFTNVASQWRVARNDKCYIPFGRKGFVARDYVGRFCGGSALGMSFMCVGLVCR